MKSPEKRQPSVRDERRMGDVSWVSVAVCIGILLLAAYNAWGGA
jgi:hypothetical protein